MDGAQFLMVIADTSTNQILWGGSGTRCEGERDEWAGKLGDRGMERAGGDE